MMLIMIGITVVVTGTGVIVVIVAIVAIVAARIWATRVVSMNTKTIHATVVPSMVVVRIKLPETT